MAGRTLLAGAAVLLLASQGAAAQADGAALYAQHCVACHQADGNGAEGLAPPLAGVLEKRARLDNGRDYLAQVLVSGMVGPIMARGIRYNGNMPAATLDDQQLAAVMDYVLATFNAGATSLSPALFARARGKALTPSAVRQQRERVMAEAGE